MAEILRWKDNSPKWDLRWISVKDQLPEENNWVMYAVLVRDDKLHRHQIAYYSKSKKWYRECDQNHPIKVTHWFPIPTALPCA